MEYPICDANKSVLTEKEKKVAKMKVKRKEKTILMRKLAITRVLMMTTRKVEMSMTVTLIHMEVMTVIKKRRSLTRRRRARNQAKSEKLNLMPTWSGGKLPYSNCVSSHLRRESLYSLTKKFNATECLYCSRYITSKLRRFMETWLNKKEWIRLKNFREVMLIIFWQLIW